MILLKRTARISDCGRFRYTLFRRWGNKPKGITWIMLNPSTADSEVDDKTIIRCMKFTERFGYKAMVVVNLFAFRATNPKELLDAEDPVGPENPKWLRIAIHQAEIVVAAWGATKKPTENGVDFITNVIREEGYKLMCLRMTKDGSPRHPLYVHGATTLRTWKPK